MKIAVLGCGRWGSFIAWYLNRVGHEVSLYGRESSKHMQSFLTTRSNGMLTLDSSVTLVTDLEKAVENDTIVISINAQGVPEFFAKPSIKQKKKKNINKINKGN